MSGYLLGPRGFSTSSCGVTDALDSARGHLPKKTAGVTKHIGAGAFDKRGQVQRFTERAAGQIAQIPIFASILSTYIAESCGKFQRAVAFFFSACRAGHFCQIFFAFFIFIFFAYSQCYLEVHPSAFLQFCNSLRLAQLPRRQKQKCFVNWRTRWGQSICNENRTFVTVPPCFQAARPMRLANVSLHGATHSHTHKETV